MRGALLAGRFLLELALLTTPVIVAVRVVGGLLGWALGVTGAALVAVVWGVLLSPRRRLDPPLATRVAIEAVLFVAAGAALVAAGLPTVGVGLVVVEAAVTGALAALGLPPGSDLAADHAGR